MPARLRPWLIALAALSVLPALSGCADLTRADEYRIYKEPPPPPVPPPRAAAPNRIGAAGRPPARRSGG